MLTLTPLNKLVIAARTADMLALPQMVCQKRRCRRMGRCAFYNRADNQPFCLKNLKRTERAVFEDLRSEAEHVAVHCGQTTAIRPANKDPELFDSAVEAVRAMMPRELRRRYAAWRRKLLTVQKSVAEIAARSESAIAKQVPAAPVPSQRVPASPQPPEMHHMPDRPDVHFVKVEAPEPQIRIL